MMTERETKQLIEEFHEILQRKKRTVAHLEAAIEKHEARQRQKTAV